MFTCHDISEDHQGDQGGGPKMAKISGGVKPDIFKGGPKMAKISGGVKNSRFWASSSAKKKCF